MENGRSMDIYSMQKNILTLGKEAIILGCDIRTVKVIDIHTSVGYTV